MMKQIQILAILMFTASAVMAQVTSDYDKNIDFTQYQTYSFAGWEEGTDQRLTDFDKKRIHDALQQEFAKRGMQYVPEDADAVVTLFLVVAQKTSTTAYTNYVGGMGYGARWGWGAGMGSATTTYSESDYQEGTLVVDLYYNESKQLAWQGVMQAVVKENPKKREKTIPKRIKKLMKAYPVPVK